MEAGARLDQVYAHCETIELTDRELLDLFRRGARRSAHSPNIMFGWIVGALGWPQDPLQTEILYQARDPQAPSEVRKAGVYYGFGLGTQKTRNILEVLYRVYMAPPFDRTTNGNMRARILWGVRDHEDDEHHLATRFAEALQDHASLSAEAIYRTDRAYRELTGREPPHAAEYASRGVYLVICEDRQSRSLDESRQRLDGPLAAFPLLPDKKLVQQDGSIAALIVVQGPTGVKHLIEKMPRERQWRVVFADLLTSELIDQADGEHLREFRKHLLPERP